MFYKSSHHVFRVPELDLFPWLDHGFGTRNSDDWLDQTPVASLRQIHSSISLIAAANQHGCLGEGDALVTAQPGLMVSVRTADCVPILLVDARNRAVAAIHAGWRGVASHIIAAPIEQMRAVFSTRWQDLHAALGPAIGPCCYQVGVEVQQRLAPWWPELSIPQQPRNVDLRETIRRQLVQAGIRVEQIYSSFACTRCHPADFHSFRRDGDAAGRMISAAGIRA